MNGALMKQEGYDLMGAAFEVYNEQGGGLAEEIYQESMEMELGDRGISFESKRILRVHYKKRALKKAYTPDLFVSDGIMVELKSAKELAPEHESQLMNYMRITGTRIGYLINFGRQDRLEWKRMVIDLDSEKGAIAVTSD